jgi:hypothetical protein
MFSSAQGVIGLGESVTAPNGSTLPAPAPSKAIRRIETIKGILAARTESGTADDTAPAHLHRPD